MTDLKQSHEVLELRSRVAHLERIRSDNDRAAREQANRLDQSLESLRQRNHELSTSEEALRRSSQLLRSVLDSIGDGVAFTDDKGQFLMFNPAARQILRLPADFENVPAAEWTEHYGLFLPDQTTPYPTRDLPLSRAMRGEPVTAAEVFMRNAQAPEGIWLSVTARPLRDESGQIHGGVAVFREVTRWKAQLAVTSVLAEADTLSQATPRILQAICNSTGWEVGALWSVDNAAGVLRCVDTWHRPGLDVAEFIEATRQHTFMPGEGLPGHVWETGATVSIRDIAFEKFPRIPIAKRCGLHTALAFPILLNHVVIGVVEFFAHELRSLDSELQSMFHSLGSQIGQFLSRRRAEEQLHRSRERFELAVQGSGDGLWDWDVRTGEVFFSTRFKNMLGFKDHELANKFDTWAHLVHPEDRERSMATLRSYFSGALPTYELEHRLRHKDGTYRWILARGVALLDGEGKPYRMAGSQTDITEKKKAELARRDSEALYHSLVETLPLNVVRKDTQGRFIFCNQRFVDTAGRSLEQLLSKTDADFYPPELAAKYQSDDRRVMATGEIFEDIEEHCKANGEKIFVQVLKAPVRNSQGAVVGTQAIFWDVTPRKLAEAEMRRARETAESASRAKSQFLANMSHEIRTPMNAIVGMSELLLETPVNAEQREFVEIVKKSADHLLCLINDVLDFSKIEADRLELDLRPFNLRECVGDAVNTLALTAEKKGLELVCRIAPDVPSALVGDPVRLRQVLINLLGNAIKFTDRGEVVLQVATFAAEAPSTTLLFEVSDTGIGIPQDQLQSIFAPFVQADSSMTRRYEGTGLGLSITRRLIEIMGGRVWVDSSLNQGSTFHFTLRCQVHDGPVDPQQPVGAAHLHDLAVLVVDDNATNRRILEETLTSWHMRPTLVADGPAALEAMHEASRQGEPFPLVLLDSDMPGMSGFTLAEYIQRHPELGGAAVMMLSSDGQSGDVARCQQLNICSYLTKPIRQADLRRALQVAVGTTVLTPRGSTAAAPAARQNLRVLLVEDNPVNQRLALHLLEKRGHLVTLANNGKEALAELGLDGQATPRRPFDIVLMDLQMPEMDGLTATRLIRAAEQKGGGHVPIVAMTAFATKGDQDDCLAAGMDGYITKPVKVSELHAIMDRLADAERMGDSSAAAPAVAATMVNWQAAREYTGGDERLLHDLLTVFFEEAPRWLADLHSGVASGDPVRVQRAAHMMKGTLGNFGAGRAAAAAERLEVMGRARQLDEVGPALGELQRELDLLFPCLTAWHESHA